jgi:hypothetical protein
MSYNSYELDAILRWPTLEICSASLGGYFISKQICGVGFLDV